MFVIVVYEFLSIRVTCYAATHMHSLFRVNITVYAYQGIHLLTRKQRFSQMKEYHPSVKYL